jgi:hypothetical protein
MINWHKFSVATHIVVAVIKITQPNQIWFFLETYYLWMREKGVAYFHCFFDMRILINLE